MFLTKSVILSIPAIVWTALVLVIDPFDYFNLSHVVPNEIKRQNAQEINTLLYHLIREAHSPSDNLLIGDSRTANLPIDEISRIAGRHYTLLTANALKLNEVVDLFWLANSYRKPTNVYVGINFSMFNEYAYADRVPAANEVVGNPLRYVFSRSTAQAVLYVSEAYLSRHAVVSSTPPMSRDAFWNYMIKVRAADWYAKYKYPVNLHARLRAMADFCKSNGINLVFIIVPHHVEFQNRLWDYGVTADKVRFLAAMADINATVVDYDYVNEITLSRGNFTDPVHYNPAIGNLIANEVWTGHYKVGRVLDGKHVQHVSASELGGRKPDALAAFSGSPQ